MLWWILFMIAALIVGLIINERSTKNLRAAAEARRPAEGAARRQQRAEELLSCQREMLVVAEQSITVLERIPGQLSSAECQLDQAESDFREGAFAPFWDSIESAARVLGSVVESVRDIEANSKRYAQLARKYEQSDGAPAFPLDRLSVTKLETGTATSERMRAIVRAAQCNFQFAVIYEQRKTNRILVAGFGNLAQALDRMTWQISASITNLASSVDIAASTLNESVRAIHAQMESAGR